MRNCLVGVSKVSLGKGFVSMQMTHIPDRIHAAAHSMHFRMCSDFVREWQ